MKTLCGSDLHTEHTTIRTYEALSGSGRAKFLLLPGDISNRRGLEETLKGLSPLADHMLYVPGNHEYYGETVRDLDYYVRSLQEKIPNLHVLQKDVVVIEGVRFVGCTLWSDLKQGHFGIIDSIGNRCDDFKKIVNDSQDDYFTPRDMLALNADHQQWLRQQLSERSVYKTVVLTHFPPSLNLRDPNHSLDNITYYMCNSNMEDVINHAAWDLWVFGHVHYNHDIMLEGTDGTPYEQRMISHTRGYSEDPAVPFRFKEIYI